MKIHPKDFRVRVGEEITLKKWPTRVNRFYKSKEQYQELLEEHKRRFSFAPRSAFISETSGTIAQAFGLPIHPVATSSQPTLFPLWLRLFIISCNSHSSFLHAPVAARRARNNFFRIKRTYANICEYTRTSVKVSPPPSLSSCLSAPIPNPCSSVVKISASLFAALSIALSGFMSFGSPHSLFAPR